jgi:hypothetical protein
MTISDAEQAFKVARAADISLIATLEGMPSDFIDRVVFHFNKMWLLAKEG